MLGRLALALSAAVALLLPGRAAASSQPRGIRNHNPGNVRWDGRTQWVGQVGADDAGYLIFEHPRYGIRALARVLQTYFEVHDLDTVRGIIERWAPPSENITASYIEHVAARTGFGTDAPIALNVSNLVALADAIIAHENGQQPYSTAQLREGVQLGLGL